jgi:alpha-N-arabinofuranosidase
MCEGAAIVPVVTLNNLETTEDMSDLIEYLHGDAGTTTWGKQRAADAHPAPYKKVMFEIGNEQGT